MIDLSVDGVGGLDAAEGIERRVPEGGVERPAGVVDGAQDAVAVGRGVVRVVGAEQLEGELHVEPRQGGGSLFRLTLPETRS